MCTHHKLSILSPSLQGASAQTNRGSKSLPCQCKSIECHKSAESLYHISYMLSSGEDVSRSEHIHTVGNPNLP
jgi:hypothetical protein